jgi:hypothetical protein
MKIQHAEWEVAVKPQPGDRWPIVAHTDSGFDMDPQEVNVGFAAVDGGPPTLMPPGVSGPLVHDGQADGDPATQYQEVPTDQMPDWMDAAVAAAAQYLGITGYVKGDGHDRRDHLRPV